VVAQEIAEALHIPVSSLSYLLTTLVDREYLARSGRRYSSGPGLARLQFRLSPLTLAEQVTPLVHVLRLKLNETASFFVQRGWEVEALVTESSDQALRYAVQTGTRTPMHALSAGKAILAALPEADFEAYLAETDRRAFTASTLVAAEDLRAEIKATRITGIARTWEEHSLGIQGIGRAVIQQGQILGALSVGIPTARYGPEVEQRAIALLASTCARIAS